MSEKIKAITLLSGGLDSALALKLIIDQGIDVTAIKFTSPFCSCDSDGKCCSKELADELDVPFKMMSKGQDYLDLIKNPKYGYGAGVNPCIDCRIYILNKAKEYAEKIDAKFFITGEVLGQRPMSQHKRALRSIERDSGLERKILRPLSAKHFPPTIAEEEGWVDREKLLNIQGRSRKEQLKLAEKIGVDIFSCAAGGCLLTDKKFAAKFKDFLNFNENLTYNDIFLLKTGRHFRFKNSKIIVGRREEENKQIELRKYESDYLFDVPEVSGPLTLLQGEKSEDAIEFAAALTLMYSDYNEESGDVVYHIDGEKNTINVKKATKDVALKYNLTVK